LDLSLHFDFLIDRWSVKVPSALAHEGLPHLGLLCIISWDAESLNISAVRVHSVILPLLVIETFSTDLGKLNVDLLVKALVLDNVLQFGLHFGPNIVSVEHFL